MAAADEFAAEEAFRRHVEQRIAAAGLAELGVTVNPGLRHSVDQEPGTVQHLAAIEQRLKVAGLEHLNITVNRGDQPIEGAVVVSDRPLPSGQVSHAITQEVTGEAQPAAPTQGVIRADKPLPQGQTSPVETPLTLDDLTRQSAAKPKERAPAKEE